MNKTERYIAPSIRLREKEFQTIIGNICKKNYFIIDSEYYSVYNLTEVKNIMFIQVDSLGHFDKTKKCYVKSKDVAVKEYKELKAKLKKFSFFVTSYSIKDDYYQEVLVFELPEVIIDKEIQNTAKNFLEGKYSKLWSKDQIEIMFTELDSNLPLSQKYNENIQEIKGILEKKEEYKKYYQNLVKIKYGTTLALEDIHGELDLPAKFEEAEIRGDSNILYQLGLKTISDIKNPETITNQDLI